MRFFRDLRFSESQLEDDFVLSRMPTVAKQLQRCTMLLIFFSLINAIATAFPLLNGNVSESHRQPGLFLIGVDFVSVCVSLCTYFYIRRHAAILQQNHDIDQITTTLRPDHFEKIAVVFVFYGILFNCLIERFRISRFFGISPEKAFNRDICQFTDSSFLLAFNMITTAVGVFLPIRMHLMPRVPMTAVFCLLLFSLTLGSPESTLTLAVNAVILIVLSYMVLVGAHMTEARERERFKEALKARKDMVTEKVARFNLEHRMEKGKSANCSFHMGRSLITPNRDRDSLAYSSSSPSVGTAGPSNCANSTSRSLRAPSREGDSHAYSSSSCSHGPLPQALGQSVPDLVSETKIETASSSASNSNLTCITPFMSISRPSFEKTDQLALGVEQESQTDLVWISHDGFRCQQCNRSPTAITMENERERVWAAVQKDGIAREASRLRRTSSLRTLGQESSGSSSFPMVPVATPEKTLMFWLAYNLSNFHITKARSSQGGRQLEICCEFHRTIEALQSCLRTLQSSACDAEWRSNPQQCTRCFACSSESDTYCVVCGKDFAFHAAHIYTL